MEERPNLPNGPEPTVTDFRYVPTSGLLPVDEPAEALNVLDAQLSSSQWNTTCEGLNLLRRLVVHHGDLLSTAMDCDRDRRGDGGGSGENGERECMLTSQDKDDGSVGGVEPLARFMPFVCKSLKSPRSSLCKTAIMSINDMFFALSDAMLFWLVRDDRGRECKQSLLMVLLQKSAQDKRFVADEAVTALTTMSQKLSPLPLMRILQPCLHCPNPRIRSVAMIHLAATASRLSAEDVRAFGFVGLVRDGGKLLTDKLPDARSAARALIEQMYQLFILDPLIGGELSTVEEKDSECGDDPKLATFRGGHGDPPADDIWCSFLKGSVDATTAASIMRVTGSQRKLHKGFSTI